MLSNRLVNHAARGALKAVAVLAVALMAPPADAADPDVKIRFADQFPENHYLVTVVAKPFMKRVEELTNGTVSFAYFPGGQLGKGKELLDANLNRIADITAIGPLYNAERLSLSTVAALPGVPGDTDSYTHALWEYLSLDYVAEEWKRLGLHPVMAITGAPNKLMLTKGSITPANEIRGLKIRSSGGVHERMVQAMGAIPVQMPGPEIYLSLQRGVIDGNIANYPSMKAYGEDELGASFATNGVFGAFPFVWAINEDTWKRLSDTQKSAIMAAGEEVRVAYANWVAGSEGEIIEGWRRDAKKTVYEIPQSVLEQWDVGFAEVRSTWAADLDKGETAVGDWRRIMSEVDRRN